MSSKNYGPQSVAFVFTQKKGLKQQYERQKLKKRSKRVFSRTNNNSHTQSNRHRSESHKPSSSYKTRAPHKTLKQYGFDYLFDLELESSSISDSEPARLPIMDRNDFSFRFTPQPIRNLDRHQKNSRPHPSTTKLVQINPLDKFTSNKHKMAEHDTINHDMLESIRSQNRKLSFDSMELLNRLHRLSNKMTTTNLITESECDTKEKKQQSMLSNKSTQTMMRMYDMENTKKPASQNKPAWVHPQVEMRNRRKRNDEITPKITELSANRYVTHKRRAMESINKAPMELNLVAKNQQNVNHCYPKSDLWRVQNVEKNNNPNDNGASIAWTIRMLCVCICNFSVTNFC